MTLFGVSRVGEKTSKEALVTNEKGENQEKRVLRSPMETNTFYEERRVGLY